MDAPSIAPALLTHDARALVLCIARKNATDGRTDALTEMGSPEMNPATNATRAGGFEIDPDFAVEETG